MSIDIETALQLKELLKPYYTMSAYRNIKSETTKLAFILLSESLYMCPLSKYHRTKIDRKYTVCELTDTFIVDIFTEAINIYQTEPWRFELQLKKHNERMTEQHSKRYLRFRAKAREMFSDIKKCMICNGKLGEYGYVDHIFPQNDKPEDKYNLSNVGYLCYYCNDNKSNLTVEDYRTDEIRELIEKFIIEEMAGNPVVK